MSENEKENQHTINQSLIKNIKIVPENIKRVEKQAWNGKCIEKTEQPVNFNTHFKSEKRTIKIYSINIDDFEENGNENEKLCAKEIVKSCEITIISENSWPNFGSNERENVENQTKQCEKKKKSQKPYIIRIYECCPWNVPWILMIISFIQVS